MRNIKIKRSFLVLICVFVFFLILGWCSVRLLYTYPVKDSGHVASWVQALGSVAAILVAVWVARTSTKAAEELQFEREARERQRIELGYRAVVDRHALKMGVVMRGILDIEHKDFSSSYRELVVDSINICFNPLLGVPMYDLGSEERIGHVSAIKDLTLEFFRFLPVVSTEDGASAILTNFKEVFILGISKSLREEHKGFLSTYEN